ATNHFLGTPADGNRYAYAADNPANYIDPTGQSWWDPASWNWGCVAAVSAAAGAVAGVVGLSLATGGSVDVFAAAALIIGAGNAVEQIALFSAVSGAFSG